MKLYDKIRILRKARGLSQEQLGDSLSRVSSNGISRQSVSDWETGKNEPKLDNIRDIAKVLNVSFDALLDETLNLDDPKTLQAVLSGKTNATQQDKVVSEVSYTIYQRYYDKKQFVKRMLWFGIPLILAIIAFFLRTVPALEWMWIVSVVFGTITLGLISLPILAIKNFKRSARVGRIDNELFTLHSSNKGNNTIYIPLSKIVNVRATSEKRDCDVEITITDRARPITIPSVVDAQKLVDFFNELTNYNQDSDEVKIL